MNSGLVIALPKGRLLGVVADLLRRAGLPHSGLDDGRLVVEGEGMRYLVARPADVVVYVREGAADLGITGKDILMEEPEGYYELLDLRTGVCRLSVAGALPRGQTWEDFLVSRGNLLRVATKHPEATKRYFASLGVTPRVITLRGALELAPRVGLADVIVDLVETGRTLKANGLCELAEIEAITARLIANPVSYRFKAEAIKGLLEKLREAVGGAV